MNRSNLPHFERNAIQIPSYFSPTDKVEVGIKISEDKKRSLDLEKLYHGSAEWSEEGRKIKDILSNNVRENNPVCN